MKLSGFFCVAIASFLMQMVIPSAAIAQGQDATLDAVKSENVSSAKNPGYKQQQAELNKAAVEKAKNIREKVDKFTEYLSNYSPKSADILSKKFLGISLARYTAAALILAATIVAGRCLLKTAFGKVNSAKKGIGQKFFSGIRAPVDMAVWIAGAYLALIFTVENHTATAVVSRLAELLLWVAAFWALFVLCDCLFLEASVKLNGKSSASLSNLLQFLNRVLKFSLATVALLFVLNNCGVNVNTILASLGIGGMALAFASQDTIANFFGSVSIIMDRPFMLGDWVKTSACEGNVEAIGFRSTRIRTFSKTLVTIPNSTLAKEAVENLSEMPARKVSQTIALTYSTTPDQMEAFLLKLRQTVLDTKGVLKKNGVSAEFADFGASSLNVSLIYYTERTESASHRDTVGRANLAIMRLVNSMNLSFAFPSTSVYIEKSANADGTSAN